MQTRKRHAPAKESKRRRQGDVRVVPESRARRETLERKREARSLPPTDQPVVVGGSLSDRAAASRVGRQPVLEAPEAHPAAKGPALPPYEVAAEEARATRVKPGVACQRKSNPTAEK